MRAFDFHPRQLAIVAGAFGMALFAPARLSAADLTKEQTAFFESRIEPLLQDNCYKCHSVAKKVKGGLALDSRESMLKGGDDGKIFIPGHPAESLLIQRITSKDDDEKMPPKDGPLSSQQIADLTEWVKMGAPDPRKGPAAPAPGMDDASAKAHWAWQPVRNPSIPAVRAAAWCKTPVDRFIAANLESKGMEPAPSADRETLIRRAYFDLVGLPPMPWEVQAFIDDKSPNAWEKVIDRLLASPHYGERWGRYWLDVARYSDTAGDAGKKESPLYVDAWTYRDYVIDSLNQDKPYDKFIREQLAADRLPLNTDKRPLAALGFLTIGDRFNGNRNDVINDQIDVVTKGFLGLTVTCARCHDHKFDPIPQADYYSLHGIFASTVLPKENPLIAPQSDPLEYQDYLKEHEAALEEVKKYATEELEKVRHLFRQNAGALLLASHASGPERGNILKAIGGPPRIAQELAQVFSRGNLLQRSPIFSPWQKFTKLPADKFAERAPQIATQIANNGGNRKAQVNDQIRAMFRNKSPQTLEEVASYYTAFFKEVDSKPPGAASGPPAFTSSLPSFGSQPASVTEETDADQIRFAPFRGDIVKNFDEKEILQRLPARAANQFRQKMAAVAKIELTHPGAPKRAMSVEDAAKPKDSPVFIRGEATSKGPIVPRQFLEILSGPNRPAYKEGSGRLELAEAIASRSNPLTARVMVNRIWEHHFGDGIVSTPDDFGTQSPPPSNPELLDYLATRFMQTGWSIKTMHRLIMLSAVYQEKTDTNPKYVAIDPGNRLLWRANIRRLEFEPLRDSLLYIAGKLDMTVGGHPENILSEPYSMRRSVYGFIDRGNLPEMMTQFDFANPAISLGKRHETTAPQQALFMMNSPLMVEVARRLLARKEMELAKTDAQRVHALYWMIYQRPPKKEEIDLGLAFLAQVKGAADASTDAPSPVKKEKPDLTREEKIAQRKANFQQQRKTGGFTLENAGEKVDRRALTGWEKYAHALLMANEAAYYD